MSANPAEIVRAHIWVKGIVQGVGFRAFVMDNAVRIGVTGWVRNVAWDTVEAVAEGTRTQLDLFVEMIKRGPSVSRVEESRVETETPTDEFDRISAAFPWLQPQVGRWTAYAHSGVEELFGDRMKKLSVLSANCLESTVFLNRGGSFIECARCCEMYEPDGPQQAAKILHRREIRFCRLTVRFRHFQLPLIVPGRFMRASLPRPSTSCSGTIAMFATEAMIERIMTQWISESSRKSRYDRANAFSLRTSSGVRVLSPPPELFHQPTVVSLSWPPVYATRSRL